MVVLKIIICCQPLEKRGFFFFLPRERKDDFTLKLALGLLRKDERPRVPIRWIQRFERPSLESQGSAAAWCPFCLLQDQPALPHLSVFLATSLLLSSLSPL